MSEKEVETLLKDFNVSKSQLPKILSSDASLPEGCQVGDIIKIERRDISKSAIYYRVVI